MNACSFAIYYKQNLKSRSIYDITYMLSYPYGISDINVRKGGRQDKVNTGTYVRKCIWKPSSILTIAVQCFRLLHRRSARSSWWRPRVSRRWPLRPLPVCTRISHAPSVSQKKMGTNLEMRTKWSRNTLYNDTTF